MKYIIIVILSIFSFSAFGQIGENYVLSGTFKIGVQPFLFAYDQNTQVYDNSNEDKEIKYRTTDTAQQISVYSNSKIVIAQDGIYQVDCSFNLRCEYGGDNAPVDFWLKKNRQNIPGTNHTVNVGLETSYTVFRTVSFTNIIKVQPNDTISVSMSTTNATIGISLEYVDSQASPNRPSTPSSTICIHKISDR